MVELEHLVESVLGEKGLACDHLCYVPGEWGTHMYLVALVALPLVVGVKEIYFVFFCALKKLFIYFYLFF